MTKRRAPAQVAGRVKRPRPLPRYPRNNQRHVAKKQLLVDQIVVNTAAALGRHFHLGPERARRLAWALLEGTLVPFSINPKERKKEIAERTPRGAKKLPPDSVLVQFELPISLKGFDNNFRRRLKAGLIKEHPAEVDRLVAHVRAIRLLDHLVRKQRRQAGRVRRTGGIRHPNTVVTVRREIRGRESPPRPLI